MTSNFKRRLYEREGGICRYCRKKVFLDDLVELRYKATIEHLVPISRGGNSAKGNLGISCSSCNGRKGNMTDAEYRVVIQSQAE